jgi:hypothetical protein
MPQQLFGEYLARIVELSGHDVSEILEEQAASRRRFGDIALAWGLCQPEHVWEAWVHQLAHRTPMVDVNVLGVDTQATGELPARWARRYRAVALRVVGDALVIAADEEMLKRASKRLPALLARKVHFVVAPRSQIDAALSTYYPAGAGTRTPRAPGPLV